MSFCVIFGPVAPAAAAIDDLHAAVEAVRHDVPVVEKRVLLEADIHEGGFEAVFEVAHLAFEDAADQAFFGRPLDGEFLEPAFLGHGDAGFERLGVDDDFLVDLLDRLDQPLDFLDQGGCRGPDGFHDSLWLFLDGHRLKRFLFLHLGGGCEVRLAEVAFAGASGFCAFPWASPRAAGPRRCSRRARFRARGGAHRPSPARAGR